MIDIEALAREAGFSYGEGHTLLTQDLNRFAAMVAEECARQAERSSSAEHAGLRIRTAFPMPKE